MNIHNALAAVPDHVPADLARDFDLYNIPGLVNGYSDDIFAVWKAVQDSYPDVFWTPRHGGHWVLTRHDDMAAMLVNPATFSNLEPFVPSGIVPHTGPSQLDAPEHGPFRKLVSLAFTPTSLN